jgi:hypothetical protein
MTNDKRQSGVATKSTSEGFEPRFQLLRASFNHLATWDLDTLVSIAPDVYSPFVSTNKSGQKVSIVECPNTV